MLQIHALEKRYGDSPVFSNVDLKATQGQFIAILGESGVGKSTLLNCIAGLDQADAGTVELDGVDVFSLGEEARARWRREKLGFVFQAFHVLPHLSVSQNVALPLLLLKRPDPERVKHMLAVVGLEGFDDRLPRTLSGGQLQRVAIARALVHRPALLLADEPTGNLDPATADRVMTLLLDQARAEGAICLLVTHSQTAAARADRALHLTPTGFEPLAP
jgi:putative ABC transport system ATP-binding protein